MTFSPRQREALRLVADGSFLPALVREDDGWHARWRAIGADGDWVDEYVRAAAVTPMTADAEDYHYETLHDAWLAALRSRTGLVRWDDAECAAFARELESWSGNGAEDVAARRALVFDFVATQDDFAITCAAPRGLAAYRALGQASFVCGALQEMKPAAKGRLAVSLSRGKAERFLAEGARQLVAAGYAVTGVDVAARVTAAAELVDVDAIVPSASKKDAAQLKLVVRVAGEPVTAEEIRFLLEQRGSLVFFRNRWIEVDRNILRAALKALEKANGSSLSRNAALAFASGIGAVGRLDVETLAAHGWLRGLVHELKAAGATDAFAAAEVPAAFVGTLRDYQRRGAAWLSFLTAHGFGALLADDMGLGKTIQTIAWILAARAAEPEMGPVLVVAPLTLLANWRHEIARFAPSLKVYVHQGAERHYASGFSRAAHAADVVLTGYPRLVRDEPSFAEVRWGAIVLDEAQAVKNPATQAARAIRALRPPRRIALTGTPVENSLADLWALEDFLNPGFLGDAASFRDRFVKPLEHGVGQSGLKRLKAALEPFVLRRLKSEPGIAAELGAKREIRDYFALGAVERRAYEEALSEYRHTAHTPGDAFALLTKLKLICDGAAKRERLFELLESIFDAGESALVFTQYAKVGAELAHELAARFSRPMPFLHGGLSLAAREREIAAFRRGGPSAFVLSLKAGGFGLNLTEATHVIHFDRWWNPAVEDQATDRAHRIGQNRNVFVHLMIAEGTLEERIDSLLERKQSLKDVIADGDAFWRTVAL